MGRKLERAQHLLALFRKHADEHNVAAIKDFLIAGRNRHNTGIRFGESSGLCGISRRQNYGVRGFRKCAQAADDGAAHGPYADEAICKARGRGIGGL